MIGFDDYQAECMRTASGNHASSEMATLNWAVGLGGEAGELLELVKKWVFHGKPLDRDKLRKEAGDVLWYLAAMCKQHELTLSEVAQANVDKLRQRYPDGFRLGGGLREQMCPNPACNYLAVAPICTKCGTLVP